MDSAEPERAQKARYLEWSLVVLGGLLLLALCAYDLKPIWGANAREREARTLVPAGTPQALAQRVLLDHGFEIRPGEWPPTIPTGIAWLYRRRSILADALASAGLIPKPARYCVILQFNDSGELVRIIGGEG